MKRQILAHVRLLAFFLCLLALIGAGNRLLVQTDTIAFVTMQEMQQRTDIELAVVGSSVVRDHIDPALLTARTGMTAFNAAIPTASFPAIHAMTEALLRTNQPKVVVAVVEAFDLNTVKELPEAQYKLSPVLRGVGSRLRYYLKTSRTDGDYIDRFLLFHRQMAPSLAEVGKTIGLYINMEETLARVELGEGMTYRGSGYLENDVPPRTQRELNPWIGHAEATSWEYKLLEETKAALRAFKALCEESGAQPLLVVHPMRAGYMLYDPDCIPYFASLAAYCAEIGLPCYNLTYAAPALCPPLDGYYFDSFHMNKAGAQLLSGAFAEVLNRHLAGEAMDGLFYESAEAYLASIDFILNCWLEPTQAGSYAAQSLHGTQVTPEYRFVLRDSAGAETLLRDYGPEGLVEAEIPAGSQLRVYARAQGEAADETMYFDYPADYEAYTKKRGAAQ